MKKIIKDRQKIIRIIMLVVIDIFIIFIASYMAILARFDFSYSEVPQSYLDNFNSYIGVHIFCTILIFATCRLYSSLWKYASIDEARYILMAAIVSGFVQYVGYRKLNLMLPRSYFIISVVFLMMGTVLARFSYRFIRKMNFRNYIPSKRKCRRNVIVYGAGEAGYIIIRELINSTHINDCLACIVDDNPDILGKYICGVKVEGNRNDIKNLTEKYGAEEIIIAIPSLDRGKLKDIVDICQQTGCDIKTLPAVYQLINGEVSVSKLHKVAIEDLLGRNPVKVNLKLIMGYVSDRVVMVTGGGGSIGSELCRQIAQNHPRQLIILDIYENNAYDIQQELIRKHPDLDIIVLIASIRNTARIDYIFNKYKPEIVYHAAAHKHVPLMEANPTEAIKNNVFGTYNVAECADKYKTKRFVMISTDKAVNPTNIMGASKRICEMIIQTINKRSKTEFVAVRFGNVLGSNGSVIPLFKKQIEEGGPVTVTHKDIIRYFMTIPEAVSLVLQAGAYAKGGEIFVLDMGEPVRIDDLAKNMIRLSGYKPDIDIKVEYTGLRPGEKLYEELLMKEEGLLETENKLIYIGKPIEIDPYEFETKLLNLKKIAYKEDSDIRRYVKEIVETYNYI